MGSCESAMEEGTRYESRDKTCSLYSSHELYKVAGYMNQDPDLWIFRRFGKLQILNILSIQQRLTSLEKDFEERISNPLLNCDDLIPNIQHTLKEYNDALAAQAQYGSYLKPEAHIIKHMEEWSRLQEPALLTQLHLQKDGTSTKDIAAIFASEKSWIHRFIDRHGKLNKYFVKEPATTDQLSSTLVYSEEGARRAEAVFIHVNFCIFLLCPIVVLLYVESKIWKLVVLAAFLLAVSVLSVGFLNTPNKTGLALVAGYAAILVVFLSNNIGS